MEVKIKKVNVNAQVPQYATKGSACFDLTTVDTAFVNNSQVFGTGLQFEVPEGNVMLVFSRSGMGFKDDVRLSNCVGVIDSDYRGEVMIKLRADHFKKKYYAGERIAQALILPVEQVQFFLEDELSNTERGDGGFGSTG